MREISFNMLHNDAMKLSTNIILEILENNKCETLCKCECFQVLEVPYSSLYGYLVYFGCIEGVNSSVLRTIITRERFFRNIF